jgi:hypothetical protein
MKGTKNEQEARSTRNYIIGERYVDDRNKDN